MEIPTESEFGDKIHDSLAIRVDSIIKQEVNKEQMDVISKALLIPQSCKSVVPVKVNPEIWASLPTKARMADAKSQQIQMLISKGISSVAQIGDNILSRSNDLGKEEVGKILKKAVEGISVLAPAHRQISNERKANIKPYLSMEYGGICDTKDHPSVYLFGEDLAQALRQTKTVSGVVRSATRGNRQSRFTPYGNKRGLSSLNYRGRYNFRGGGRRRYRSRGAFPPQ